ncbi:hypothetical protein BJ912DRAFT_925762 [Pholiota molesta]|nr:hypothetical protein BJ912DRAFT_925762 [Pholiota molesta]
MYGEHDDTQWTTTFLISQGLAVALTSWRLGYRYWRWFSWWDDVCSALAGLASIIMFAHLSVSSRPISIREQSIAYWVIMVAKALTMWATRLCTILSVGRLDKDDEMKKRIFILIAWILLIIGLAMTFIANYACAIALSWLNLPGVLIPENYYYYIGLTNISSIVESSIDLVLMLAPLYVTRMAKTAIQKRILVINYSCTVWMFAVNTAFTITFLHEPVIGRTIIIWLANLSQKDWAKWGVRYNYRMNAIPKYLTNVRTRIDQRPEEVCDGGEAHGVPKDELRLVRTSIVLEGPVTGPAKDRDWTGP